MENHDLLAISLAVGDLLVVGSTTALIYRLYNIILENFTTKRLGPPTTFLGWTIKYGNKGQNQLHNHLSPERPFTTPEYLRKTADPHHTTLDPKYMGQLTTTHK